MGSSRRKEKEGLSIGTCPAALSQCHMHTIKPTKCSLSICHVWQGLVDKWDATVNEFPF